MKIKLALLDSDQNYLNRIVTAFNIKYADKLEIYSFTKLESAMAAPASAGARMPTAASGIMMQL